DVMPDPTRPLWSRAGRLLRGGHHFDRLGDVASVADLVGGLHPIAYLDLCEHRRLTPNHDLGLLSHSHGRPEQAEKPGGDPDRLRSRVHLAHRPLDLSFLWDLRRRRRRAGRRDRRLGSRWLLLCLRNSGAQHRDRDEQHDTRDYSASHGSFLLLRHTWAPGRPGTQATPQRWAAKTQT